MRFAVLMVVGGALLVAGKREKVVKPSPLELYVGESTRRAADADAQQTTPGSLWTSRASLSDLARDLRASQVDDIVTVVVSERASAVASGSTKTSRTSSAKNSITALAGPTTAAGILSNLTGLSGQSKLDGQGTTTRDTTLTTSLSARVVQVLPNGYLVVEGTKNIQVDGEHQLVSVHGVIRPSDITTANTVTSTRLAELEVRINGKGVVNDATHRPLFLYRLLLGLLPF